MDICSYWFGFVDPGLGDPVMCGPLFGILPLAKGGWIPFYQAVGAPDYLGWGRDPTASSILTLGSLWQPHPTQDQPAIPGDFGIDPSIGGATTRVPAASREDSHHPQIPSSQ